MELDNRCTDPEMIKRVESVFNCFNNVISSKKINKDLPFLWAYDDEANNDGSVFIEWVFDEFRFGISLEADPRKSFWHMVSKSKFDNMSLSNNFDENNKTETIEKIITITMDFLSR